MDEDFPCPLCGCLLKEPFVLCAECNLQICLKCFAAGKETLQHKNFHQYTIKSASFSLFDKDWSAFDELKLLEATNEYGFGNWSEISKCITTKTKEECESHYLEHYINSPSSPLPQFKVELETCWRRPKIFKESEFPPRPGHTEDDMLFMVGYMPARGDFLMEHDNFAEGDLKDVAIKEDDDELITALNLAMVDIYHHRLRERERRKKMLRDFGLLDAPKTDGLVFAKSRHERDMRDQMRRFARWSSPDDHEKMIQSFLYERHLESEIGRLQEYRTVGLTKLKGTRLYEKLKRRRKKFKPNRMKLDDILLHTENPLSCQVWLQRQLSNGKKSCAVLPNVPMFPRKPSLPLDLTGLPGKDKLTEAEEQLCSSLRLYPESYLYHRNILQRESFHQGGLKLQSLRNLLKIDVNKTKRLFEFCVSQGYIKCKSLTEENTNEV